MFKPASQPQSARHREDSPLFSELRIENTNACAFRCIFCPREKLTREIGIMPLQDLELVLERVGDFSGQVDLHGFGEPLLDPRLREKIALVSSRWPAATVRIFSTLGLKMTEDCLEGLLAAGLNHIEVSLYDCDAEGYLETHGKDTFTLAVENLEQLCRLRSSGGYDTTIVLRKFPLHHTLKPGERSSTVMEQFYNKVRAMGVSLIRERALHNYGGGRTYNAPGAGTCSIVHGYRKRILQVTWELDVVPCCFDFNGSVVFGNLRDQTIAGIFSGEPYRRFIKAHIENNLENYSICSNCDRCFKE
jgi:MoaA/NifB/PqqE/SkfB family radical SAM enzyme